MRSLCMQKYDRQSELEAYFIHFFICKLHNVTIKNHEIQTNLPEHFLFDGNQVLVQHENNPCLVRNHLIGSK